jgi:transcriptional regulator GlxA family with amidase domain
MDPRNFVRIYHQKTGRTPARAVEVFRVETASLLLEDSSSNVDQIASRCGFRDEERMRVTFQPNFGVAPTDYRKRFSA